MPVLGRDLRQGLIHNGRWSATVRDRDGGARTPRQPDASRLLTRQYGSYLPFRARALVRASCMMCAASIAG